MHIPASFVPKVQNMYTYICSYTHILIDISTIYRYMVQKSRRNTKNRVYTVYRHTHAHACTQNITVAHAHVDTSIQTHVHACTRIYTSKYKYIPQVLTMHHSYYLIYI